MIIFGESTLNNAVAIALATSIAGIKLILKSTDEVDYLDLSVFTVEKFCTYFFLSFIIGGVWALLISFVFAVLDLYQFTWIEIGFFTLSCYFPYIFCEAVGCSGVISIFIAGSVMRNYAFYSLGSYGKITIEYLVDTVGFTTENFVFAYLGISIPLTLEEVNYPMAALGIAALMISRAVAVLFTSSLVGCCNKKKIPFSHQIVFIYAGLRGAVAFYLALNFLSDKKSTLLPCMISIIIFTVIGLGGTTVFVIKLLNKCFPNDKIFKDLDVEDLYNIEKSIDLDAEKEDDGEKGGSPKSIGAVTRLENFDRNFLQKLLRKDGWDDDYDNGFYDDVNIHAVQNFDNSVEERISAVLKRTDRGGDLSPYRNSIMHKKNIPKELSHQAAGQLSFRDNFSRRIAPDGSFITPNKNRESIGFSKRNEFSSFRNFNLLHVTHAMNDNNIDFSAARRQSMRKSMRVFSQHRRSKADSKSDISYAKQKDDSRAYPKAGNSFSPHSQITNKYNEQPRRLDDHAMPFNVTGLNQNERDEYLSDKFSGKEQPAYIQDDVVHEAAEADESEKAQNESKQDKREVSESNSRLKEGDSKEDRRKKAEKDINISINSNW